MCRADLEGDAIDDESVFEGAADGAAVEMKSGLMSSGVGSEGSERCDRKLRDVVMILTLAGLMVVTVPF